MPPKALSTRKFFSSFRTTDMDTETTGAENTLPEQEAPRKSGRPPPIGMTFITKLITKQLKTRRRRVGIPKYTKRNRYHNKINEGIFSYEILSEKNNLNYFIFSPNSENPIKAVICHLLPETRAEYISNSLEDLGFNIINVRQMTANRRATHRHAYMETLSLFLVTLRRHLQKHEMFKLNSLNHIIDVEPYRAQTGLTQCYNC
jgi:hypothetical protein